MKITKPMRTITPSDLKLKSEFTTNWGTFPNSNKLILPIDGTCESELTCFQIQGLFNMWCQMKSLLGMMSTKTNLEPQAKIVVDSVCNLIKLFDSKESNELLSCFSKKYQISDSGIDACEVVVFSILKDISVLTSHNTNDLTKVSLYLLGCIGNMLGNPTTKLNNVGVNICLMLPIVPEVPNIEVKVQDPKSTTPDKIIDTDSKKTLDNPKSDITPVALGDKIENKPQSKSIDNQKTQKTQINPKQNKSEYKKSSTNSSKK